MSLQRETNVLKLEHAELKKLQDAVQSENVHLRQDVNNLKDALTKEFLFIYLFIVIFIQGSPIQHNRLV